MRLLARKCPVPTDNPERCVETCFGVEPNRSAFAARSAPGAARRGASDRSCTGTDGLEDRGAASYTTLAKSRIPESNRNRANTNGKHDLRADAATWRACKDSNPCSGVLEAPLRPSLRPISLRPVRESDPSQPMDSRSATPVASRGIRAPVANRTRTHRLRRPRTESIGKSR